MKNIKKVVGYSRFSSINQSDSSTIQTQQNAIEEYCKKNNFVLITHYVDLALSGREAEHRIQFQEMIQDIEDGGIDAVIVYTRDRFSRSIKDFLKYLGIMEKHKCELICVNESYIDSDSPSGKLSEWIIMSIAQYYVENLARESLRGLKYNAENGMWNTIAPFGYTLNRDTKKLEIDPYEAKGVRFMFERYLLGDSQKVISEKLNEMGYRTKRGLPFHKCIRGYLKNRVYIGEYNYHIYKSEKQQHIVLTDIIPKIIDDEIFEKVQIKLNESNPKRNTSTKPITLLKGKVYCGYTNYVLSYHLNRKTFYNEIYYYDSKCKSRNGIKIVKKINADKLNDLINLIVHDYLINVQNVQKLYHIMNSSLTMYKEQIKLKLDDFRSKYVKSKIQLNDLIRDLSSGKIEKTDFINKVIEEISQINDLNLSLESNINLYENRLSEFESVKYRQLHSRMSIIRREFENNYQETLLSIIDKVVLYNEVISIFINLEAFVPQLKKLDNYNIRTLIIDIERENLDEILEKLCEGKIKFEDLQIRRLTDEE